jgi:hypothetical protein
VAEAWGEFENPKEVEYSSLETGSRGLLKRHILQGKEPQPLSNIRQGGPYAKKVSLKNSVFWDVTPCGS